MYAIIAYDDAGRALILRYFLITLLMPLFQAAAMICHDYLPRHYADISRRYAFAAIITTLMLLLPYFMLARISLLLFTPVDATPPMSRQRRYVIYIMLFMLACARCASCAFTKILRSRYRDRERPCLYATSFTHMPFSPF